MPRHMYVFSDSCPSDWLGNDDCWHTIANFVFETDPVFSDQILNGALYHKALSIDSEFAGLIRDISERLPNRKLRQWKSRGSYKSKFCNSLASAKVKGRLLVSAVSFQESTIRTSEDAIRERYYQLARGSDGRAFMMGEYVGKRNKSRLQQTLVNFNGSVLLDIPREQALILYLMALFYLDQYRFYSMHLEKSLKESLVVTVVTDQISGDNDTRQGAEYFLRTILNPDGDKDDIRVVRANKHLGFAGDLFADNMAGFLNAAISQPNSDYSRAAIKLAEQGVLNGWHVLLPSVVSLNHMAGISAIR